VIVHDLDVGRFGISIGPLEANPPLVVDAVAVLTHPVPFQEFKTVTLQSAKRGEGWGLPEDKESSVCLGLES